VRGSGAGTVISLSQAAAAVGAGVVYRPVHGPAEDGTIVAVNDRYVMVLYVGDRTAKATRAEDLSFLSLGRADA